jgi:hypothetical protein
MRVISSYWLQRYDKKTNLPNHFNQCPFFFNKNGGRLFAEIIGGLVEYIWENEQNGLTLQGIQFFQLFLRYIYEKKRLDETVTTGKRDLLGCVGNAICGSTAEFICTHDERCQSGVRLGRGVHGVA